MSYSVSRQGLLEFYGNQFDDEDKDRLHITVMF